MNAQKERKTEYKREHFAILRRKRGGEWIVRSYRYNALGMLHAKEATGSNSRTTLEELIAGKEAADDPDGDADKPRTTTYVYDLTQPYYEVLTESTDGKVTSYTYGLERLAAYTEQVQTKYLYDGRGSVIQTIQVNTENSILGEADRFVKAYSPFGELLSEKVSGYGFNGEYFDAATGMLNLRARQYEPAQGRFSQKDSEKGNVANARSLNAYLYCYNDGVNYFDADGAKPEVVRNNTTVDPGGGGSTSRLVNQVDMEMSKNAIVGSHGGHSGKIPIPVQEAAKEYRKNHLIGGLLPMASYEQRIICTAYLAEDLYNFNLFNTDEKTVLNSHFFSAYKGKLVLRHDLSNWLNEDITSCGFLGIIWLNINEEKNKSITVQHEYGHLVQEDILQMRYGKIGGEVMYWFKIAKPSLSNRGGADYYSYLWERGADYLGGVDPEDRKKELKDFGWKQTGDPTYISTSEVAMFYMLSGLDEEDFNLSPEEVITKYTGKRNALQKKKQKSVPYPSYGGGGNNNNIIFMLN